MNMVGKSCISLFLAVFALGNTWIHVGIMNSGNVASNIEAPINQHFGSSTTLKVSDIHLDDSYIRFWEDFNDTGLKG